MTGQQAPKSAHAQSAERFVWPPRKPVEVVIPDRPPPPADFVGDTGAHTTNEPKTTPQPSWWSNVQHTWLDTIAPPLRERMALENWSPDAPGAYCPRCGLTIRKHEIIDNGCADCRAASVPWQRLIRLGEYRLPLRRWVHEVKFTRWRKLGRDLGRLLGEAVAAEIERERSINPAAIPISPPLIVPVPTTLRRLMFRGIDHSRAIALGVADRVGGKVIQPLAREHRPSQLHVAPSRRAANIAGAIHPRTPWRRPDLAGRLVIVVDDVTTTGATLRAVCRGVGLCGSGKERPRVWAAVLAKTPPDSHDLSTESG